MEKEVSKGQMQGHVHAEELWHTYDSEHVLKELNSSEKGISDKEAVSRREKYGLNEITEVKRISPIKIALSQFNSFLIYILFFAALISAILTEWVDFFVIFIVIFINSSLGFIQQYKAEKAIEKLKHILKPRAKIIREGVMKETNASEIIPGDILFLEAGDKVMADARIIICENLKVNEAVLTGESVPVDKISEKIKDSVAIADRKNMLYLGTSVVAGDAKAIVVATGMSTEFGKIASIVQETRKEKTHLQERMDVFSKQLGITIIVIIAIVAILGFLLGLDRVTVLLTSVSLAVAVIPEGLPIVITICLALTVQRMYKVKSLTRRLSSAETLGHVTVICSDKTGTITSEEMQVTELFCNNSSFQLKTEKIKENHISERNYIFRLNNKTIEPVEHNDLMLLLKIGCLCNNARFEKKKNEEYIIGDPTEKALIISALGAGLSKEALTEEEHRVKEFPFHSNRKLMSIIRRQKDKAEKLISYVKGSPEIILERCDFELLNGRLFRLNDKRKEDLIKIYEKMASNALRVLGFAYKELKDKKVDIENAENGLVFVGFQGMFDSPREEVKEAIKKCRDAGIKVKMITGDSALTAIAVAKLIGLDTGILTGHQIKQMSDTELSEHIEKTTIFARIDPEDKVRIVSLLKKKKETVAVTGDGVNDAPALKRADIGIAMGIRGTDVTRDVADMILMDDNFASIVKAVEEGRRTDDNIRNFIKFMLGLNFSELLIIFIPLLAIFFKPEYFLPLLPIQILWVNLVTDSIPSLALSVENADKDVMKRRPRSEKGIFKGIFWFIILTSIIASLAVLLIFIIHSDSVSIEKTRTMVFTSIIMFQMFFVLTCRSEKSLFEIGIFSNKAVIYSIFIVFIIQLVILYTPLAVIFKVVPLALDEWVEIIPVSISGLVLFEGWKIFKRKKK